MSFLDAQTAACYTQTTNLLNTSTERGLIFTSNVMGFQSAVLEATQKGLNTLVFTTSHSVADPFISLIVENGYEVTDSESVDSGIELTVSWPKQVNNSDWDAEREEIKARYLRWLNSDEAKLEHVRDDVEGCWDGQAFLYWLDEYTTYGVDDKRCYFAPLHEIPTLPDAD